MVGCLNMLHGENLNECGTLLCSPSAFWDKNNLNRQRHEAVREVRTSLAYRKDVFKSSEFHTGNCMASGAAYRGHSRQKMEQCIYGLSLWKLQRATIRGEQDFSENAVAATLH